MAKGYKTGGRKKGVPNKMTLARQELARHLAANGLTPLDVMLSAMREAWDEGDKATAAKYAVDAAPYVHPRLAATSVTVDDKRNLDDFDTHELIAAVHAQGDPAGASAPEAGDREPNQVH